MGVADVISVFNKMESDGIIERYAIGGAVGATFYLEPSATVDVDVFVSFRLQPGQSLISLKTLYDYLTRLGCIVEGEYVLIAGWPVQFLPISGSLSGEALADAVTVNVENIPARVFTAEHLAAMALQTGRAKDKARLLQFIEAGVLESRRFEAVLARHGLTGKWQAFKKAFSGQ
ncbi:hypothetical protein JW906_01485 [bacterium]|nr:hypothetical protein [bacterium]